jgi:hypothetical protein
MKVAARGYGARRRFRISPAIVTVVVLLLAIGVLLATGQLDLARLGLVSRGPDTRGLVAVPVSAGAIPMYTKLTRDHL